MIDFLLKSFESNRDKDAIIWQGDVFSYGWLLERIQHWTKVIQKEKILPGSVVVLDADFSPNSAGLFLALAGHRCILVPLTGSAGKKKPKFIEIAQGEISFVVNGEDEIDIGLFDHRSSHKFYQQLKQLRHPGLVLFSSGSTGESKAIVHDLSKVLKKFYTPRSRYRTISFLLYDHFGGINTMLYTLSNAGCLVTLPDRNPDTVLGAIEQYQVEMLPTSPTFINLILFSEAYRRYNLNSLRLVTYGTEPMPESTLKRFTEIFPKIRMLQTYGLSEVGVLRSKSKRSDSLWVKVGGEGFETRVHNRILYIKAESAMLGYLNAANPFTDDGWLNTGDLVEEDGEYIRLIGRKSEIINVGGEKVFPIEVENIIQQFENVGEVTVYGEKNPIVGNIVCADVRMLTKNETTNELSVRLKKYCRERLEKFKVPVKISIVDRKQHSERFKKVRAR